MFEHICFIIEMKTLMFLQFWLSESVSQGCIKHTMVLGPSRVLASSYGFSKFPMVPGSSKVKYVPGNRCTSIIIIMQIE